MRYAADFKRKRKTHKDMTVEEFRKLIRESIAEDMTKWRETFEILSDKELMRQMRAADRSHKEGNKSDFIPWDKVRRDV